jgi:hypothetical protein
VWRLMHAAAASSIRSLSCLGNWMNAADWAALCNSLPQLTVSRNRAVWQRQVAAPGHRAQVHVAGSYHCSACLLSIVVWFLVCVVQGSGAVWLKKCMCQQCSGVGRLPRQHEG